MHNSSRFLNLLRYAFLLHVTFHLLLSGQSSNDFLSAEEIDPWLFDENVPITAAEGNTGCDFPVLTRDYVHSTISTESMPSNEYPFVLKGFMSNWPANLRWRRETFIRLYGDKWISITGSSDGYIMPIESLQLGSNSLLQMSESRAEEYVTFKDAIVGMRQRIGRQIRYNASVSVGAAASAADVAQVPADTTFRDSFSVSNRRSRARRQVQGNKPAIKNLRSSRNGDAVSDFAIELSSDIEDSAPALMLDIKAPRMFRSWENEEAHHFINYTISLGPAASGVHFKSHGQSWVGVVYGMKKWFVYPPGYEAPKDIDATFNSLYSPVDWLDHVAQQLRHHELHKPPVVQFDYSPAKGMFEPRVSWANRPLDSNDDGYRPLECVQEPGDIVYIPEGWRHLYINLAETIAVSARQTLVKDKSRLDVLQLLARVRPNSFETWRDLGVLQAETANEQLQIFRNHHAVYKTPGGLKEFRNGISELMDFIQQTGDTTLVLYYDSTLARRDKTMGNPLQQTHRLWDAMHELTDDMEGEVDVLLFNLKGLIKQQSAGSIRQRSEFSKEALLSLPDDIPDAMECYVAGDLIFTEFPTLRIHRGMKLQHKEQGNGRATKKSSTNTADDLKFAQSSFQIDRHGLIFRGSLFEKTALHQFIRELQWKENLLRGSITRIPARIKLMYAESMASLSNALNIKPLNIDLISLTGEVAGLAHEFNMMHTVIDYGVSLLRNLDPGRIAAVTLSSAYHKLAIPFLHMQMNEDAMPLLEKSLDALSTFMPAMHELIRVYCSLDLRKKARRLFDNLDRRISAGATRSNPQLWAKERAALIELLDSSGSFTSVSEVSA